MLCAICNRNVPCPKLSKKIKEISIKQRRNCLAALTANSMASRINHSNNKFSLFGGLRSTCYVLRFTNGQDQKKIYNQTHKHTHTSTPTRKY